MDTINSKEQIPGSITDVEKELNWTGSHQDELNTQLLKASIAREENKKRKEGLGHQFNSEGKGLNACASHLESAFASLVTRDNKFLELQVKVSELLGEVLCLSSAAKDRFNDNA